MMTEAGWLSGKRVRLSRTVEPLLRGHPDERPTPLEKPLDIVNLNTNVLIFTPDERPPLLKGHFSGAKGVASQEGFHCSRMCSRPGQVIPKTIIKMVQTRSLLGTHA